MLTVKAAGTTSFVKPLNCSFVSKPTLPPLPAQALMGCVECVSQYSHIFTSDGKTPKELHTVSTLYNGSRG